MPVVKVFKIKKGERPAALLPLQRYYNDWESCTSSALRLALARGQIRRKKNALSGFKG